MVNDFDSALAQEKQEEVFKSSIEGFKPDKLKHAQTQEKNPLPSTEGSIKPIFHDEIVFMASY